MVDMCIRGEGVTMIGSRQFAVERFDVWNTPSMAPYHYRNDGKDLFVRMSYSNAPLLERLEVHYVDVAPTLVTGTAHAGGAAGTRARDQAEDIALSADGARHDHGGPVVLAAGRLRADIDEAEGLGHGGLLSGLFGHGRKAGHRAYRMRKRTSASLRPRTLEHHDGHGQVRESHAHSLEQ